MTFAPRPIQPQRIAIIGGGISGMASAYLLAEHHDVTLFEAAPDLGGHARTVIAGINGNQPVDTGFIVFNYANYPHMTRMFQDLDVPVIKSDMSFGASINNGEIEYASTRFWLADGAKAEPSAPRLLRNAARYCEVQHEGRKSRHRRQSNDWRIDG